MAGRQVVSFSIDIVIDPILGNLVSAKVVAFWLAILGAMLDLLVLGRGSCAVHSGFGDWMLLSCVKFNTSALATCCCRRLLIFVWLFC